MAFEIKMQIKNENEIESETVFACETKAEADAWILARRLEFNRARLSATVDGRGIRFLNRTQTFFTNEIDAEP